MSTNIIAVIGTVVFFILYLVIGIPIIIASYLVQGVRMGVSFFGETMKEYMGS